MKKYLLSLALGMGASRAEGLLCLILALLGKQPQNMTIFSFLQHHYCLQQKWIATALIILLLTLSK